MPDVRLIDANALIKDLELLAKYQGECKQSTILGVCDTIKWRKTIDAVPVVRCKDCKFRGFDFCPMCHDEYTYDEDDGGDYYTVDNTTDDGFCHMGAKMDGKEG